MDDASTPASASSCWALAGHAIGQVLLGVPLALLIAAWTLGIVTVPLGVGLFILRAVAAGQLSLANLYGSIAGSALQQRVPATWLHSDDDATQLVQMRRWLTDGRYWRLTAWTWLALIGLVLSALPFLMGIAAGVLGIVTWALAAQGRLSLPGGATMVAIGLALVGLVRRYAADIWLFRARRDVALLTLDSKAELSQRVEDLTTSRAHTVDHSAAEIRRIERDLHDGAQVRLVALAMNLGMAADLMDRDPEQARALLQEARGTTSDALQDVRGVVRGIMPPVLADRGLSGAVRALVLSLPLRVETRLELPGRPPLPVESAVYFAVAECLTNAAKHAAADSAQVALVHDGTTLHCLISDDGRGGAVVTPGGGLAGMERRLAAFDGRLFVDSPAGGPTLIRMEVPCALSSPRTTPS